MNDFLVASTQITLILVIAALLVYLHVAESRHRKERGEHVRALMSRTVPEFVTMQRIVEGDASKEERRLRAVNGGSRPSDEFVPSQPEGL